jgi:plastocyanin
MDYRDRTAGTDADRTVRPMGSTGYTPRCLRVRVGQRVTFEMDFGTHPLVAGIPHGPTGGATSPNPIAGQTTGMSYGLAFTAEGFFPFYCNRHGHVGMAGVVRVVP